MAVIVFDLGGTLMEYRGMPPCWADYYPQGFRRLASLLGTEPSPAALERSVKILESFNPRLKYREREVLPEHIFRECLEPWKISGVSYSRAAELFFRGLQLEPFLYPDTLPALQALHSAGHTAAVFTDLPSAMPDHLFRKDLGPILNLVDLYVSSQTCGFRKPNPSGLQRIAEQSGTSVNRLAFIGDEEKDRLTAERAGCRFLKLERGSDTAPYQTLGHALKILLS